MADHGVKAAVHAMGLGAIPDTPEEQAKRQKRMARFQEATQPEATEVSTPLLPLLASQDMLGKLNPALLPLME